MSDYNYCDNCGCLIDLDDDGAFDVCSECGEACCRDCIVNQTGSMTCFDCLSEQEAWPK